MEPPGRPDGAIRPDRDPIEMGSGPARSQRWWEAIVQMPMAVWSAGGWRSRLQFEEALHAMAEELGTAATAAAVESALLELVRRLVPAGQVELVRSTEDLLVSPEEEGTSGTHPRPRLGPGWTRRRGEDVAEIPLRCGAVDHGSLRVLSHAPGRGARARELRRRLTTACTMASAALENVRRQREWQWAGSDAPSEADRSAKVASGLIETRVPADPPAAVVRDATFLNAVLPFALGQAKRHSEPLSLLCVGVDRLGAIQDLLGPAVADRLVQQTGRTVAGLVRSSDIVARLDDDRIVALLVRARGASALHVAQVICRTIAESNPTDPELPAATVSIGVAEFPAVAHNVFSLLDAADEALTDARRRGRNQAVLSAARHDSNRSAGRCCGTAAHACPRS
jgi:diguanylate cyclase (GGDEF)-like protein